MNFSYNTNRLILLKIVLYLIIFFIIAIPINRIWINYKKISNLSKEEICSWFNKHSNSDYVLSIVDFKLKFKKFNIHIEVKEILLYSLVHFTEPESIYPKINIHRINAKVNILSALLFNNIKVKNFIANNITFTANHLYVGQQLDKVTGEIHIKCKNKENLNLQIIAYLNISTQNVNINIQTNKFNDFKLSLVNKNSNVRTLIKYLPENIMGSKLILWLDNSLLTGEVKYADLFVDQQNNFNLNMNFESVLFNYAVDWPVLENLNANLKIINNNLEVYMVPSKSSITSILNQPIKNLKAKLNLNDDKPLLIQAQIVNASVLKGIEFLQKNILFKYLGDGLSALSMQGDMNINIDLWIPVKFNQHQDEYIKYLGKCHLNQVYLKLFDLPIHNVNGGITFSDNYLAADNLTGTIFNVPIKFNVLLDKHLLIINNGFFTLKTILKENNIQSDNLSDVVQPSKKEIVFTELSILDNSFQEVAFINDADDCKLLFNNDDAKGTIVYRYKSHKNQLTFDFDTLKIVSKKPIINDSNNHNILLLNLIKSLNFKCNKLYVDNIYLGNIEFHILESDKNMQSLINLETSKNAENNQDIKIVNQPLNWRKINNLSRNYFEIDKFQFLTKSINAYLTGIMQIKNLNNINCNINGKIASTNFGSGLRELNINHNFMANGNGYINFKLNSELNFSTINLSKINGDLEVNISSGFILGIDPGFGRIIGLLNIENIQRRLLLDFKDITNQGFSFDNLKGEIKFINGQIYLDKIVITGPAADIVIKGDTSLLTKRLNLLVEVVNKSGATLPLAAAVAAGNPVIGAAMWLFDYASGAKFSKFKFIKYKITGNWNKPEIIAVKEK